MDNLIKTIGTKLVILRRNFDKFKTNTEEEISKLKQNIIEPKKLAEIILKVKGKDGKRGLRGLKGKDGKPGLDGKDGEDGKDGTEITPEIVRDKLESLVDYEQLNIKYISGTEDLIEEKISKIKLPSPSITGSGGGGTYLSNANWGQIEGDVLDQTDLVEYISGKENSVTAGTTAQYYRGDKTFQTLDKSAVGLSNVDNTSDLSKPVSTATQSALDEKVNTAGDTMTGDLIINAKLGINTASPSERLELTDSTSVAAKITAQNGIATLIFEAFRESAATHARFQAKAARGTSSSPNPILSGDQMFNITSIPYISSGTFGGENTALILGASEDQTSTAQGSYVAIQTTLAGTTTRAEKVRIIDSGRVGVGTTSPNAMVDARQASTTAAIPTVYLTQADLSEEFIEFNGTVSAGNPIDTAAIGTYYGKIRVSVNGTFKYIALYNS